MKSQFIGRKTSQQQRHITIFFVCGDENVRITLSVVNINSDSKDSKATPTKAVTKREGNTLPTMHLFLFNCFTTQSSRRGQSRIVSQCLCACVSVWERNIHEVRQLGSVGHCHWAPNTRIHTVEHTVAGDRKWRGGSNWTGTCFKKNQPLSKSDFLLTHQRGRGRWSLRSTAVLFVYWFLSKNVSLFGHS